MLAGLFGKAGKRAEARREKVAGLQKAGAHREALVEAVRGLRTELAKLTARNPQVAQETDIKLTAHLLELAEQVARAGHGPAGKGNRND
jgi:hypothetical protein